jgi:anti-sigma regulatory factor (Ser/Thr protein kinase)
MRPDQLGPAAAQARPRIGREHAELVDATIPLDGHAPGLGRSVVKRTLAPHVTDSVLDDALLLVSELITNSVRHCGAPEGDDLVVRVKVWREACRLEVEDRGCDKAITPRHPDPAAGSGMGLNLVEMLSEHWGVIRTAEGRTRVWAQLPCARAAA